MSAWRGLANPERHGEEGQGAARLWCECGSWCSEDALCDCCELVVLQAEVERLTAELASRDRRVEAALRVLDTSQTDIAAELARAVREALRGES